MPGYRAASGGAIDRHRALTFSWHGRRLAAFSGDTLASALLANGVERVGRSFKYHRPRGLLSAGLEEPNGIVEIGSGAQLLTNLKATTVEVYEGLEAKAVNCAPSPDFDAMAALGLLKRFIPAGFYYKTFIWPNWNRFEPMIRRAAGLGRAPREADPDTYDQRHHSCDCLIVGGGIAGLSAALRSGSHGSKVLLVTGGPAWGGRLGGSEHLVEGVPARQWVDAAIQRLAAMPNVTMLERTLAIGYYDDNLLALCERRTDHLPLGARSGPRQRLWKVRAGQVVLATGAIERPMTFAGNDLPGVMLADAARLYLERYGVIAGRRIVVATNNDSAWHAALALAGAGASVVTIADTRAEPPTHLREAARKAGITVLARTRVLGAKGRRAVTSVMLGTPSGTADGREQLHRERCDCLLMSGGWNPAVHLHSQAGGALAVAGSLSSFVPAGVRQDHRSIGAAAGHFAIEPALDSAWKQDIELDLRAGGDLGEGGIKPHDTLSPTAWVDFQNDVTAADVALAVRENYRSVEHLKRYTTLGMGSDQGKTANITAIAIASQMLALPMDRIGTTKFRPPFDPTTIGVYAAHRVGDGLAPRRHLAAHGQHQAAGALFEEYGGWTRPSCYPAAGENMHEAVLREVNAVRGSVGLFEASPLGKIEVKGPDAAEFLDRIYVNTIRTLKPGRCRYALQLNEGGIVFDDGIVTRLSQDRFLVGTTSGHASAIAENLREWLDCEWPDLAVLIQDVTTCWATMTIAGPRARDLLSRLDSDIDVSREAFPHMQWREGRLGDAPCRIARVSFSGELSYEVSVPWDRGAWLWGSLTQAGSALGAQPFGVEALMTMRIEKGFLHVGADTDGTSQPQDVGMGGIVAKKAGDFVGRRSLARADSLRADRRQFVGLELTEGEPALTPGAHILAGDGKRSIGWVTSSAWSPSLRAGVALAMIEGGRGRMGERVAVFDLGRTRMARIIAPCRLDPEGTRLDA